ncbi:VOC family protein [Pseudomonas aeruginosa]|uniref:VOC family protein n=1 Tax=Pseudomonas TaxID=286 RepID=UPI001C209A1D|nr:MULTISPECIES: VOC family protein [Pseudomonas]MCK2119963.1 VOC family protein [Pseudomonas sp. PNPG3]HCF1525200.1 VOC family protein [Pseudomonas aeruginosa]HEP8861195.1 VOC family protein [Pseudomonas aeruginosa]
MSSMQVNGNLVQALGYLGITSPAAERWRTYGSDYLGAQIAADGPNGAVRLKFDKEKWRIQITPGEVDKVDFFGWLVNTEEDLQVAVERLGKTGVEVTWGSAELAAERSVNKLIQFTDPWGMPHEIAWGQLTDPEAFRPGRGMCGGFVTGSQGLGHVVLAIPDLEAGHAFFSGVLGFQLSDKIITPDGWINARFYHVNARHHTLALGQGPAGVVVFDHLMLQVNSIDDVGWAYDNMEAFGLKETLTLGRHTNDQMVSFYHQTPSLFNIEYGYAGREITPEWVPRTYTDHSIWGHKLNPDVLKHPPGIVHKIAG